MTSIPRRRVVAGPACQPHRTTVAGSGRQARRFAQAFSCCASDAAARGAPTGRRFARRPRAVEKWSSPVLIRELPCPVAARVGADVGSGRAQPSCRAARRGRADPLPSALRQALARPAQRPTASEPVPSVELDPLHVEASGVVAARVVATGVAAFAARIALARSDGGLDDALGEGCAVADFSGHLADLAFVVESALKGQRLSRPLREALVDSCCKRTSSDQRRRRAGRPLFVWRRSKPQHVRSRPPRSVAAAGSGAPEVAVKPTDRPIPRFPERRSGSSPVRLRRTIAIPLPRLQSALVAAILPRTTRARRWFARRRSRRRSGALAARRIRPASAVKAASRAGCGRRARRAGARACRSSSCSRRHARAVPAPSVCRNRYRATRSRTNGAACAG